jgi:hypothetical protein
MRLLRSAFVAERQDVPGPAPPRVAAAPGAAREVLSSRATRALQAIGPSLPASLARDDAAPEASHAGARVRPDPGATVSFTRRSTRHQGETHEASAHHPDRRPRGARAHGRDGRLGLGRRAVQHQHQPPRQPVPGHAQLRARSYCACDDGRRRAQGNVPRHLHYLHVPHGHPKAPLPWSFTASTPGTTAGSDGDFTLTIPAAAMSMQCSFGICSWGNSTIRGAIYNAGKRQPQGHDRSGRRRQPGALRQRHARQPDRELHERHVVGELRGAPGYYAGLGRQRLHRAELTQSHTKTIHGVGRDERPTPATVTGHTPPDTEARRGSTPDRPGPPRNRRLLTLSRRAGACAHLLCTKDASVLAHPHTSAFAFVRPLCLDHLQLDATPGSSQTKAGNASSGGRWRQSP